MKREKLTAALNAETTELLRVSMNFEIPADGTLPAEIVLIPAGLTIASHDGRTYTNDNPGGVIDYFNQDGRDLVIDWFHATELKAPNGDQAPAAGWCPQGTMKLNTAGETVIAVDWTPKGKESLLNRETRYISPVYLCEKGTMRIRGISSIGLTNKPNLFLPALNCDQSQQQDMKGESIMDFLTLLAALLGLSNTATQEQCLNACKDMKEKYTVALNQAQSPPLTLFVPRADYDGLMIRCNNAEKSIVDNAAAELKKEANTEIEGALQAKKITPATRAYYEKQCNTQEGLASFREFVKAAPVIAMDSNLDGKDIGDGKQLNAEAKAMADIFGNSAEDLKKYA